MPAVTTALLLSAGLGTRLRPLTSVRAKPAIPVAGVPMARRIITRLASAGVTDVVLNLHARPETVTRAVGDGSDLGVRARYSWEHPVVLGSAGGPRQALDILGVDTFLIVNGDTLTDVAIAPLLEAHASSGASVTLAVVPNRQPERYSGLRARADGTVTGVAPRGSPEPSFHFIGVQVAHRSAFDAAPAGRPSNSIGEIYDSLAATRPGSVRVFPCDARFWDIGTVADYWSTSRAFDADGSALSRARPEVGPGGRIADSIVWDNVTVGAGATVESCILTDGVHVEPGRMVSHAILLRDGDLTVAVPFEPDQP
jgi:mannose-1-phosphate guanylyltransferase